MFFRFPTDFSRKSVKKATVPPQFLSFYSTSAEWYSSHNSPYQNSAANQYQSGGDALEAK
jgi:hypothetical protein